MKKIIILILMLNVKMNLAAQNAGVGTTNPEFKPDVKNGQNGHHYCPWKRS
jgi:hypothetical protein